MKKIVKSKLGIPQLIMILFITGSCMAQNAHPAFKSYTVEDGLPSSEVYQVKQDSKGYIWFATGNGVSRFNGYEFENFSMANGLPDNTVFEIYEDRFERIWFLPLSCKLSYYYKGKIYPFPYNDQLQKTIANAVKTSFCVDSNGTVFIGFHGWGIFKISKNGKIESRYFPPNRNTLNIIEPIPGTYIYNYRPNETLKHVHFETKSHPESTLEFPTDSLILMATSARVIHSKSNNYLIGTNQDLLIIDQKDITQHKKVHFPSRIVWLYEDHDGDLWVGLLPGGVYYIEKEDFENKKLFLPGLSVTGILQDKEGGFWYTTEGNGVFYASSKKIMVLDKRVGFSDRIICLATDKKQVFVGSQSGLVDVVEKDIKVKTYDLNFGLTHFNEISDLFYDPFKKDVWIAGKFKSGKIKNGHFINEKSDMMFNAMLVDSSHVYWMATSGEFIKIENNKISDISNIVLSKTFRRLNAITQKDNNTLMLGAINGLWTYKKAEKEFRYIGYKHKMLQNRILGLGYFSDSVLVMATKGSGVLLYDKNDVTQINTSKGLCGDNVYAICIDSSTIWAATNKGLNRIDIKSMYPLQYKIFGYTNATGLPSNEINDVLKADGKIWVATNKGLSFFYPDSIENKVTNIPLYMTRILINEKDTTIRENYELAYDQNNIKINFIGIGYKNAGKMKYRYKMIGLDTNWTYTNTREVQYTTLPANKYTFVLNVLQEDGFWCTNTLMIHFNVALPFWKKWWFILSTFAVGMYGTFYLFKYRLKTLHQRRAKIDDLNKTLVSLKLKALRAQMNPHFTFNVMNSIQHFIANNDGEAANRYLSRFSKLIRLILNNSERNLVPIADEIKALELYLELEAMRFEKRFVYQIMVDKCIDILEVEIPSMLIQPYVENSIKHGILNLNRQGIIKITIEKQDHLLKCVIEDNGVGRTRSVFINKGSSHKSFGTTITQERLAAINALNNSELSENVIDLEDEYGNPVGTRVEIYIPFN